MVNYKLVDSNKLDTDLETVANSIRAKAGKSGKLVFPDDFKNTVDGIVINTGTKVQIKTGSFTVNNSGASVDVGFKPDLVVIKVGTNQYNSTQNDPAFGFTASGKTALSITSVAKNSSYMYMNTNCTQTASGFSVGMTHISTSHQTAAVSGISFKYVAVKYT